MEAAITITASDDNLSRGHAEYFEARLIEEIGLAGRVTLDNGTTPDTSRRRMPEAIVAIREQLLASLKIVLPVIGLDSRKPRRTSGAVQDQVSLNRAHHPLFRGPGR